MSFTDNIASRWPHYGTASRATARNSWREAHSSASKCEKEIHRKPSSGKTLPPPPEPAETSGAFRCEKAMARHCEQVLIEPKSGSWGVALSGRIGRLGG